MNEQLQGRMTAWWANDGAVQSFERLLEAERVDEAIGQLSFLRPGNDMARYGWVKAGEAEVAVTLLSRTEVVTGLVESLRQQQQDVRAQAEMNCRQLEERIQTLLAITHEPEAL